VSVNPRIIALLAIGLHALIRVVKSEKINALLASAGMRPIPKTWLPWIAAGLGILAGTVQAMVNGMSLDAALDNTLAGLFVGATAVWGHEAAGKSLRSGSELGAEQPTATP